MALDRFGRRIQYLRISLTDRCNLRCLYCMPDDITFRPVPELMQDEEIYRLVRVFASLGFDKIRLTGGEPTIRANVVEIVRTIRATPGIRQLTMTTNGILLPSMAAPLAAAGLQRVNISLDTIDPARFDRLTRVGKLEDVWRGIASAEQAGLTPIKLNTVIVRDHNESDILGLARLTQEHPWHVRFIEMMPFGNTRDFQTTGMVTAGEIQEIIAKHLGTLTPVNHGELDGDARLYTLPGAQATLGFIATVSAPFCWMCSRARLTADGVLRMCLLRELEVDLLTPLRQGAGDDVLRNLILDAVWNKPWGHGLADGEIPDGRAMSQIGG